MISIKQNQYFFAGSIISSLQKKNIPTLNVANPYHSQMGYGKNGRRRIYSNLNSSPPSILSEDKFKTKVFLNNHGLPVPKGFLVKNESLIKDICKQMSFPIVLKPTDSIWGKGVTTNINSVSEASKAFLETNKQFSNLLFEEEVAGDDHRLLVINGKFVAAMKRIPPEVTGDGILTIRQLIISENRKRKINLKNNPYRLGQIKIDYNTPSVLSKQNLSLSSVLTKGRKVRVRMNANIKTGGKGINVTEKVHPSLIEISERAARLVGLFVAGVDIITKDISLPIKEGGAKITELNNEPGIDIHIYPYKGKPINVADIIVDSVFPDPDQAWIPIYINGKISKNQEEINKHLSEKPVKVTQLHEIGSKKELMIKSPSHKLITYLLDPLTTSVYLEAPL
jgi:cyanophycin synthetase